MLLLWLKLDVQIDERPRTEFQSLYFGKNKVPDYRDKNVGETVKPLIQMPFRNRISQVGNV